MFSLSPEDDEGTFSAGGSSKLASLFGHDKASFTGGNESLTYTAPKQPKKEKQVPVDAPVVAFATAVHAYRYVNGQYASQGKLGAAILANHTACDYKILLYVSKQQQAATAKIYNQFVFTVQANNYASFCDDQRQRWSICFDSEKNASQFAKQIGLAMFNCTPTSLLTQDITPGEGQPIETGDAIEVKYTGWLLANGTFGKVFDSNAETDKTFKFKTGKGKVIKGWDQGVIGMKKGSKRFIGIPAALAYGAKGVPGRVPANSALLFEVEILRVKSKDGSNDGSKSSSRTESPVTVQDPPPSPVATQAAASTLPNIMAEPSGVKTRSDSTSSSQGIKGRASSLSEHLSQSPGKGTDKARLLARMSKMGKNVLTIPGAVAVEPEPDEEELPLEEVTSPVEVHHTDSAPPATTPESTETVATDMPSHSNPHPNPRPKPQLPQRPVPVQPHPVVQPVMSHPTVRQPMMPPEYSAPQQLAIYQAPQQPMPVASAMTQQYYQQPVYQSQPYPQPMPHAPPPPPQATTSDAMVPVLMAETRQQQSEVRMAISKVAEKVDEVLHKVDRLQQGPSSVVPAGPMGMMPYQNPASIMEPTVLLNTITRIVQENEKLKTENAEQTSKIDTLNEKVSDLLQKNQRFVEKSNIMMEQSSDSLQHNTAASQVRVLTLEQEKTTMTSEVTVLKTQLNSAQTELASLRKQDAELRGQTTKVTTEAERLRIELESLKESLSESQLHSEKLKQDLKEEKQTRKRLESRADHIDEEMADLQHEKEKLEKSVGDRKKKHTQDRRKFEEELEELRAQHEDEIKTLKEKHRREKRSSGSASSEEISKIESDLEARWTEKAQKMVSQAEQKWQRKYDDLVEEKEELSKKLSTAEERLHSLRSGEEDKDKQLQSLQEKVEEMESLREKYTSMASSRDDKDQEMEQLRATVREMEGIQQKYQEMRNKTLKMKEQYEEQLESSEEERELAVSESYQKGFAEGKRRAETGGPSSGGVVTEVKKVMNNVFHVLKAEFDADTDYTGAAIMAVVLQTIKEMTLKLINPRPEDEGVDEEDDNEYEDEEEEEESDEEGESEEESEEEQEETKVEADEKEDTINKELSHENTGELEYSGTATVELGNESKEATTDIVDTVEHNDDSNILSTELDSAKDAEICDEQNVETDVNINVEEQNEQTIESETKEIPVEEISSVNNKVEESALPEETLNVESHDRKGSDVSTGSDVEQEGPPPLDDEESANAHAQETSEPDDSTTGSLPGAPEVTAPSEGEAKKDTNDKLKSLFGEDDHDDIAATFGPSPQKIDLAEEPSSKPIPPPLFDDDDDDDDIDWFK